MTRIPFPFRAWLAPAVLALAACAHAPSAREGVAPQAAFVAPAEVEAAAGSGNAQDPALAGHVSVEGNTLPENATVDGAAGNATEDAAAVAGATAAEDAPVGVTADGVVADPRTDAERDFDALYGTQASDPFAADPTVPAPAALAQSYDPWEGLNRRTHRFNNAVDRTIAKPLAKAYLAVTPRPVRLGVSNFFNNLGQPLSSINALLQGKPKQAAQSFGRFLLNSTLGIAGIFDPATDAKLPNRSEDFGQTLGVWGWKQSRYVEVPLFGPRTVRDLFGMAGDAPVALLRGVEEDKVRVFLQGLQLVEVRTQLLAVDGLREGAADDYALVRDSWLQRRNYQIFGDRQLEQDDALPDYLREENNPTVPIDAIPVTPMDMP